MRKEEFQNWLKNKIKPKSISDRISRCIKVESALNVDLDEEFKRDGGASVMRKLTYTFYDRRDGKELPKEFSFDNPDTVVLRMTDLRSAVKRYLDFCGENRPE